MTPHVAYDHELKWSMHYDYVREFSSDWLSDGWKIWTHPGNHERKSKNQREFLRIKCHFVCNKWFFFSCFYHVVRNLMKDDSLRICFLLPQSTVRFDLAVWKQVWRYELCVIFAWFAMLKAAKHPSKKSQEQIFPKHYTISQMNRRWKIVQAFTSHHLTCGAFVGLQVLYGHANTNM